MQNHPTFGLNDIPFSNPILKVWQNYRMEQRNTEEPSGENCSAWWAESWHLEGELRWVVGTRSETPRNHSGRSVPLDLSRTYYSHLCLRHVFLCIFYAFCKCSIGAFTMLDDLDIRRRPLAKALSGSSLPEVDRDSCYKGRRKRLSTVSWRWILPQNRYTKWLP